MFSRNGHGARYHSSKDEHAGDHAVKAAKKALEAAKVTPEQVDLIIVSTDTPAFLSPAVLKLLGENYNLMPITTPEAWSIITPLPTWAAG